MIKKCFLTILFLVCLFLPPYGYSEEFDPQVFFSQFEELAQANTNFLLMAAQENGRVDYDIFRQRHGSEDVPALTFHRMTYSDDVSEIVIFVKPRIEDNGHISYRSILLGWQPWAITGRPRLSLENGRLQYYGNSDFGIKKVEQISEDEAFRIRPMGWGGNGVELLLRKRVPLFRSILVSDCENFL